MAGAITPVPGVPFSTPSYVVTGSMTGTSTISGPWVYVANLASVAFQAVWTGTPTGTFAVNVSQDASPANVTVLGGSALTLTGVTNPAGAAGSSVLFLNSLSGIPWIQLTYTNATGSGSLSAGVSGK